MILFGRKTVIINKHFELNFYSVNLKGGVLKKVTEFVLFEKAPNILI